MKRLIVITLALCFIIGWLSSTYIQELQQQPSVINAQPLPFQKNLELASPSDWIKEKDIHVYKDRVVIDIENPVWAKFTNTNSMDPVLDETAHAIEIVPKSQYEIKVGDIISYKTSFANEPVIHRVKEIGNDGEWFAITKGDNNPSQDPEKVRFDQVKRILVAVIY